MIRVKYAPFNRTQRIETAKMLLGICEVILLAIIAGPFIDPLANRLTAWDTLVGTIIAGIVYFLAIKLLQDQLSNHV